MLLVTLDYEESDNCGLANIRLTASSSEPGGEEDIEFVQGDVHHVYLRAERSARRASTRR